MNETEHRSGYVALVGRPNAGKSTLLNRILETKLAAVTSRPQTTRNRIFGIFDRPDVQIVFQDTPGLLDPADELHSFMMREAERALEDADVVVWLIDSIKGITNRERVIASKVLAKVQVPMFMTFNKIDAYRGEKDTLLQGMGDLVFNQKPEVFYLSALHGDGVEPLLHEMIARLPVGPKFFPSDQLSDRATRFFIEEIIREKAFLAVHEEVPYSIAVQVESFKERENGITAIQAVIHVGDTQRGSSSAGRESNQANRY